jgi:hypothetical protein
MRKKIDNPIREAARRAGNKTFNSGVSCQAGHSGERYVSSGKCTECVKARVRAYAEKNASSIAGKDKAYREANKVSIGIKRRAYYEENIERFSVRNKEYREANRELLLDRGRTYYQDNREVFLECAREYYRENRDSVLARAKSYYAENTELLKVRAIHKRAARAKRIVDWGPETTAATLEKELQLQALAQRLTCEEGVPYEVDHMLPMQGKFVCGLHVWNNLQVLPERLNVRKGNRMILTEVDEWLVFKHGDDLPSEPSWCRDAEEFYRARGWDFKRKCYK